MILTLALFSLTAQADKGMWLPEQIPAVAAQYDDLEIDPAVLADPTGPILGSVVSLGGCSGSFVSADGLIVTNHHCVEGYLQSISDDTNNRWRDGFVATSRKEEAPTGPAGRVYLTSAQTDVTESVLTGITKRTKDAARADLLETNKKALITECEKAGADRRCRVASFDGGARFLLIERRQLNDLRVVWAPPRSVGQFGGDIDNWEWPRHGFDTALVRVYVAPDGSSAAYSEDNIPYQPKHHLEMSPGLKEGDLAIVAGYPGRTRRNRLASELAMDVEQNWGRYVKYADRLMPILEKHAQTSESASARLGPWISGMANGRKNRTGVLEGIARSNGVALMGAEEQKMLTWMREDKKRARRYEPIYRELSEALNESRKVSDADRYASRLMWSSDLLSVASTAVRWAKEQEKPDVERKPGLQERDRKNILRSFNRLNQSLYLPADQDVFADSIAQYLKSGEHQRWSSLERWINEAKEPATLVSSLYGDAPKLAQKEARINLLDMTYDTIKESTDPFIQLAISIETDAAPRREASKARSAKLQRLRAAWSEVERAYADQTGQLRAPDANSTLRITLGHVMGYEPEDGLVAKPFTSLAGFVAKVGPDPFDAPPHIVEAAKRGASSPWAFDDINHVPIDFLADLDTTGGNSGSACFDSKGRLAGLLFDGVWESVANDYVYDEDTNRSIVADVRGLGWLLSVTENAQWIADEMGLTR
jgi:hypothetical protein